jgi:DNA ligase-1
MGEALPDGTVLDGEIVVWREDVAMVRPRLLNCKSVLAARRSPQAAARHPVVLLAYDLLEWQGRDLRALPQSAAPRVDGTISSRSCSTRN